MQILSGSFTISTKFSTGAYQRLLNIKIMLFTRTIHQLSRKRGHPYVSIGYIELSYILGIIEDRSIHISLFGRMQVHLL